MGCRVDVLPEAEVIEEVELLEHHADEIVMPKGTYVRFRPMTRSLRAPGKADYPGP
jgi:hypothetical protein